MSKYKGYLMTSVCIFIMGLMIVSCGSKKKAEDTSAPQNFLPESSAKTNLKRISDVRTFVGQTLWEYIDGGAEIYYLYDFEIVATADYKADSVEIVVDIYKFDSPDNAYGLYSMLRPVDAQPVKLGLPEFSLLHFFFSFLSFSLRYIVPSLSSSFIFLHGTLFSNPFPSFLDTSFLL